MPHLLEHLADAAHDRGSEPVRRLVEQHQPRVRQQRARHRQHLLLAA
jgi:hypothetical protein